MISVETHENNPGSAPKSKRWTLTITFKPNFLVYTCYFIFTELYLLHKSWFQLNFEPKMTIWNPYFSSVSQIPPILYSKINTFQLQFSLRGRDGASIRPTSIYVEFYGDFKNVSHIWWKLLKFTKKTILRCGNSQKLIIYSSKMVAQLV